MGSIAIGKSRMKFLPVGNEVAHDHESGDECRT